jgi:hypothetical protein
MPRTTNSQTTSALDQIRKIAGPALAKLRSEIHAKEGALRRLKEEESKLVALVAQGGVSTSNGAPRPSSASARRTNWGSVLAKLPRQFKAADIRTVRAVQNKRSSELFAAITRWMEAGAVKRKDRGRYERVR